MTSVPAHRRGLDRGAHAAHVALIEQALRAPMASGGADADRLRELGIGDAAIALQMVQDAPVDPVQLGRRGRFFH